VFILYGVVAGVVVGLLLRGRLEHLASIRFRLWWLAVVALAIQVALFSPLADGLPEGVPRIVYVASTIVVAVVVLANLGVPCVPLIALGAALNLAAIVANGGAMPASETALTTAGISVGDHTNSVVTTTPALQPLTDVFALPAWVPLANVFSVGDVLIGVGLAFAIAFGMRRESVTP
jgi:Family of unknown function (DUF5317)